MKNLIILLLALTLNSCGSMADISYVTEKTYIGMTEAEFLKVANGRAKKDAMNSDWYAYRINKYNLDGIRVESKFFYFDNKTKRLFEVNSGSLID